MTLRITELPTGGCRYPLNDNGPLFFCGDPVRDPGVSYCPAHAARCFGGHGKDWRGLESMINATEQTITRRG